MSRTLLSAWWFNVKLSLGKPPKGRPNGSKELPSSIAVFERKVHDPPFKTEADNAPNTAQNQPGLSLLERPPPK